MTQLVRSPGAYLMEPKDATKQVFIANLMPSAARGSSSRSTRRASSTRASTGSASSLSRRSCARSRPRTLAGFALDTSTNEKILELFDNSPFIANTLEKDDRARRRRSSRSSRSSGPASPTLENARNLLRGRFFDPKRYDLTKVGRYKLNQRLEVDVPDDVRVLTTQDILALVQRLVGLPKTLGVPRSPRTSPPTRSFSRASRSGASSTSTSTSATGASAPWAS